MAEANLPGESPKLNRRRVLKSLAAIGAAGSVGAPKIAEAFSPDEWIKKAEELVDHLGAEHTIGETFAMVTWVPRSRCEQDDFLQLLRGLCDTPINHVLVTEQLKAQGRIRYIKPFRVGHYDD